MKKMPVVYAIISVSFTIAGLLRLLIRSPDAATWFVAGGVWMVVGLLMDQRDA